MRSPTATGVLLTVLVWAIPSNALAQRRLHWDRLEVTAHLNADGTLTVAETQTMVFTGAWNGGERRFNIRPGQGLTVAGVLREVNGRWGPLNQDSSLDDIDEFAMTDTNILRWRSRLPTDPPFSNARIRYQIRYVLSGILQKDEDGYRLDHDFAFTERDGPIERFELTLTLDPEWQPLTNLLPVYTAGPLPPGRSFVLEIPLRYTGAGTPGARDLSRSWEIVISVSVLLAVTFIAIVAMLEREQRRGRFDPLETHVDEAWIREHILKHKAEVVAAAWDENVGTAEVVALIARMVADGQLDSGVGKTKKDEHSMTLWLKVKRETLNGHERALVDKLFFNNRTETSTGVVRAYYQDSGFSPADEIRPALEAAVDALLAPEKKRRRFSIISIALLVLGIGLVIYGWTQGYPGALPLLIPMLVITGLAWISGLRFRSYLHWGRRAAVLCLMPALVIAFGTAAYLWFYAGAKLIELAPLTAGGIAAIALACVLSIVNAMKSRRSASAIAFRRTLTAGREYFLRQLAMDRPAVHDEWYPWLLGLELSHHVDAWTTRRLESGFASRSMPFGSSDSSGSSSFSGFGGGRSGGAGASAGWYAAASGMAASISPPSSNGSSGGSSGGGSSGGGSSGGGGGGGW